MNPLRVPHFVCHFHLAADVGEDILGDGVARLRQLFREVKLRPKLRAVARSLAAFATDSDGAHVVAGLIDGCPPQAGATIPVKIALGAVQGLVSWILAFSRSGDGYGFPFDVTYLALYERVVAVNDMIAAVRTKAGSAMGRVATGRSSRRSARGSGSARRVESGGATTRGQRRPSPP